MKFLFSKLNFLFKVLLRKINIFFPCVKIPIVNKMSITIGVVIINQTNL